MNWWETPRCSRPPFCSPQHICLSDCFCYSVGYFGVLFYVTCCTVFLSLPVTALAFSVALGGEVGTEALPFHGLGKGGAEYCMSGKAGCFLSPSEQGKFHLDSSGKQNSLLGSFLNNLTEFKRMPALPKTPHISQPLRERWSVPLKSSSFYVSFCNLRSLISVQVCREFLRRVRPCGELALGLPLPPPGKGEIVRVVDWDSSFLRFISSPVSKCLCVFGLFLVCFLSGEMGEGDTGPASFPKFRRNDNSGL